MTIILQFNPMVSLPPVVAAPDIAESMLTATPPPSVSTTPAITEDGTVVTPDSLTIVTPPTHGTASVSGVSLIYTPAANFAGLDSFTYYATKSGINSNTATVTVDVIDRTPCQELGRVTRQYVSGYTLATAGISRVRRMSKRCCVANFNGALSKGRLITSVRWETTSPWAILMENARIATNQREAMVDVTFNFAGWGGLLCTATLDNGEVYNCEFNFTVLDMPLYPTADYPTANGPYRLDASV
jgi:hypothetical protein